MYAIFAMLLFAGSISSLFFLEKAGISRTKRNLYAILIGTVIGLIVQHFFKGNDDLILNLFNILGVGYIRFLQMLTFPMVVIAILLAFLHIGEKAGAVSSSVFIILLLLATTAISAFIGFIVSILFSLDLTSLIEIFSNETAINSLETRKVTLEKPIFKLITDFISTNPFADLTGSRPSSLASIVIFFSLIGFAYLKIKNTKPELSKQFKGFVELSYDLMMVLVSLALKLTPYGILGLFVKMLATVNILEISKLLNFILASYLAIAIMFVLHGIMLLSAGLSPIIFYKKVFLVLSFGFFSRSSSAAIPLNIETQTKKLGIPEQNAAVSASFGSTIGQNGCAGIYPAMLVTILAPHFGFDVFSPTFILSLLTIVTINSFGIAGVGGGAIFAAIASLSAFNMPFTIIAILAGIEPIIDMARTALNINGTIVSSAIVSRLQKTLNLKVFKDLA